MKTLFTFNVGRSFPPATRKGFVQDVTSVTIGQIRTEDYLKYIQPLRATGLEVSSFIQLYDHQTAKPIWKDPRAGSEIRVHDLRVEPAHRKLPEDQGYAKDPTLFLTAFIDASRMALAYDPHKTRVEEEEELPF